MGTNFGAIRQAIKENKKSTRKESSKNEDFYIYDSSIQNFGSSFSKTLPKEYTEHLNSKIVTSVDQYGEVFKEYIEDTLSKSKNHERTAIEFGGPGSKLFQGFKKDFFKKTAGVCLKDVRDEDAMAVDKENNHSVVSGDFINGPTRELYAALDQKLGGKKVDLITSRIVGPLDSLVKNPAILEHIVRKWYSMLNDNGLLFAQFEFFEETKPYMESKFVGESLSVDLKDVELVVMDWAMSVMEKFPKEIDIQLGRGVIRIHKKQGAPEELPTAKELAEDSKHRSNRIIF